MKMTAISMLCCLMVFGAFGSVAFADGGARATHTSLTEDATATWCGYCKYAAAALKEIYEDGTHDFYYISLVDDKCVKAKNRIDSFNLYGFPTVYHDGGFKVNVGAGSTPAAKTAYKNSLNACGNRAVPDIDIDLQVEWLGGAEMRIITTVTNNESDTYKGDIRIYITETVSSLNWKDTANKPYRFALLDFAIDEELSIPANSDWTDTTTWDGADHNSGYGQNYGSIKYNNITVIAAVFNEEKHQGYSYPPSQNPFDAYYVDETEAAVANTLSGYEHTLAETGGSVDFGLYAGRNNMLRNYYLVGGVSGSLPGTTLPGGEVLPVNFDVFTYEILFPLMNTAVFADFYGTISVDGTATATLTSGPLPSGYVGTVMTFAYCLAGPYDFVSNPVEVEIVP